MKHLRVIWHASMLALLTLVGWVLAQGVALAQQPKAAGEAEGGSYVASYSLVLLAIALGMMMVCRPASRRDRAKPEVYDDIKGTQKD